MTAHKMFSDEDLTAYLDGESDQAMTDAIQRQLSDDIALANRLDQLVLDKTQIETSFQDLLAMAPDAPAFLSRETHARHGFGKLQYALIAAAAVLCLLAGGIAGNLWQQPREEAWFEFVATYQALYINSTLAHVKHSPASAQSELDRVSQSIGKALDLSKVSSNEDLDYKRAQILGFEGQPLAQLTFLSKVGAPIALCIIRSDEERERVMEVATRRGMSSAIWSKGGYEFMLIGGEDDQLIERSARQFASLL